MIQLLRQRLRVLAAGWRARAGRPIRIVSYALAALVSVGLLPGDAMGTPPNVVLVVIDTLRADRLGSYGNWRGLTPFLDELARRGAVFSRAYSTSSWTVPSIASIFTSRQASQHHVTTFQSKIGDSEVTVAEKFDKAGYVTAGFFANFRLFAKLGYGQGFATWEVVTAGRDSRKPRGAMMRQQVIRWFDRSLDARKGRPVFLYLHYVEPHAPYLPPEPFRSRVLSEPIDQTAIDTANALLSRRKFAAMRPQDRQLLETLYDGEVAAVDAELRAMFQELEKAGILDDAVVVVTADHGEEFREHGHYGHGNSLFEESVRVPLLLLGPKIEPGRVIERNISLLDLAPTMLDLAGLPAEPAFEGRSLAALASKPSLAAGRSPEREPARDVILELPRTGSKFDRREHERGIVRASTKLLIFTKRPYQKVETAKLYDLSSDPGERQPNPAAMGGKLAELEAALRERTEDLAARAAATSEKGEVDEATKEKLRALGYPQ